MPSRFARNVLTGYFGKGAGMALGLVLVPFLIGKLGKNSYGLILMTESLIALMEILSTSIRSSIAHHTTLALAEGRKSDFFAYLSTGRRILWGVTAAVLAAGFTLSFFAPAWMGLPASMAPDVRLLLAIMTLSFAIGIPNIIYWTVLYSHGRLDLISFGGSAFIVLRAVFLLAAFTFLPSAWISLPLYGAVYLGVTWAKNRLIYRWHRKIMQGEKISFRLPFDREKARRMFSFSFFYTVGQFSYVVYENVMGMMLFFLWGPAANALYGVSLKIPAAFEKLYEEPTWALTPVFTDRYGKKRIDELREWLYAYTKIACLTVAPVCLSIAFFSEPLIARWVGPEFSESARILPLHALPLLLSVPFAACYGVMSAAGKVKVPGLLVGPSLALMLGGGLVLGKWMGLGLYGMVLAEAAVTCAYSGVFYSAYACRIAGLSLRDYWLRGYLAPMAWAAGMTLAALAVFYFFRMDAAGAAVWGAVCAAGYVLAGYKVVLGPRERDYFRGLISRFFNRLRSRGMRT